MALKHKETGTHEAINHLKDQNYHLATQMGELMKVLIGMREEMAKIRGDSTQLPAFAGGAGAAASGGAALPSALQPTVDAFGNTQYGATPLDSTGTSTPREEMG